MSQWNPQQAKVQDERSSRTYAGPIYTPSEWGRGEPKESSTG